MVIYKDSDNSEQVYFGDTVVNKSDKHKLVGHVFTNVSDYYDIMNDAMSLGLHRLWKRQFVNNIILYNNSTVLDLASGSGDIAIAIAKNKTKVVMSDINESMLEVGIANAIKSGVMSDITPVLLDAQQIPFVDNSFDIITISFGLRNVTNIALALSGVNRVLKPGGVAHILEFSQVSINILSKLMSII